MTMPTFNSATEALGAVLNYPVESLPEFAQDGYRDARVAGSAVDSIVNAGEIIYAARAAAPLDAREMAAGLISYATTFRWHGLGGGRGDAIVKALLRDMGDTPPVGTSWPAASADPAALTQYAPPAPAPATGSTDADPATTSTPATEGA